MLPTFLRRSPADRPEAAARSGISRVGLRRILIANLAGQVGIVLTGGVVRLTGSGLGCPTFPECVPGSYVPVVTQPQGSHKYIEFGNRMLTFVVTVLAVAALVAVLRHVRSGGGGRRLLLLGAVPFVGVAAQALIGGITVLTGLNPTVVAIHFLVSMALIALSTLLLLVAVTDRGSGERETRDRRARLLAAGTALTAALVLTLGTAVTGSGPHSGDAADPNRFGFDIQVVARLHSGAVWLFTILLLALMVTLRRSGAPANAAAWRNAQVLLGLTVAQGLLGYAQYALGVPAGLVALHMLAAALFVVGVTATAYAVLSPVPVARPHRAPDLAPAAQVQA